MISEDKWDRQVSYWPSVSDLFMTLFIITIALVGVVVLVVLPDPVDKVIVAKIVGPVNHIRYKLGKLPLLEANTRNTVMEAAIKETSDETIMRLEEYENALCANSVKGAIPISQLKRQIANLQTELDDALEKIDNLEDLQAKLDAARKQIDHLEDQIVKLKLAEGMRVDDKPPIITIADADKRHFFASGSALLTKEFIKDLNEGGFQVIATEILKRNQNGRQTVDTLEIIGHTDGVPVVGRGNLDAILPMFLEGNDRAITRLSAGSNNDLGLMRALAIKREWHEFVSSHTNREVLEEIAVRTYSAGQTIPVKAGRYTAEDAQARRIELRLTKLR